MREAVSRKEAPSVDILGADGEETAFLKGMCEDIIAGKAPVCHENRAAAINIAVNQLAEGCKFIFEPARLYDHIQIALGKQVIEGNGVEGVEALL